MSAPSPARTRNAGRAAVPALLLVAGLVGAAPAGACVPLEHDDPPAVALHTLVLVNGVHTAAGLTAKLARQG